MLLFTGLLIWIIMEFIFFILHRNPPNETEILKFSQNFTPENANFDHIKTENGSTKFKNYKLHRELCLFH